MRAWAASAACLCDNGGPNEAAHSFRLVAEARLMDPSGCGCERLFSFKKIQSFNLRSSSPSVKEEKGFASSFFLKTGRRRKKLCFWCT
jgi:hypothetical protein